jgi:hypothetical protein
MQAPFYLSFGDLVIENGTGAGPYHVISMRLPAPEPDGFGGWRPAQREFRIRVVGETPADVDADVAALRRALSRDELVSLQAASTTTQLTTRIREASVTEVEFDPLERSVPGAKMYVTATITTDPYWIGPSSPEVSLTSTVTTVPGHFDVTGVTGEVGALLTMRVVPASAGRGLFIGVKPDPAATYDYLDDYGTSADTADANALGGYKKGAIVDSTLSADIPAQTVDTNGNRGRHLLIARADSTAIAASTNSMKARTTTTGHLIAASVSVDEQVVQFSSNTLIGYELGDVQIPAGQVPDITTDSGWGDEGVLVEQTDSSGSLTVRADYILGDPVTLYFYQTYTAITRQQLTAFEFTVVTAPSITTGWVLFVDKYNDGGYIIERQVSIPSMAAGLKKVSFSDVFAESGSVWRFRVKAPQESLLNKDECIIDSSATDVYAGGTAGESSSGDAPKDLLFKVYGKTERGFNSSTGVLTACTESSRTIALDYVQRIPLDYAVICYRPGASGSLGLYYDGQTDTPYVADADGIGPAVYDKCEIRKPLRLSPGVTNRVVIGILQEDTAVAGFTALSYSWRPRYLSATG